VIASARCSASDISKGALENRCTTKQIGFAVVFAVAEKLAVQLERPQQLIADGFLVTFLCLF
jgi:hypothetical protein